MEIILIVLTSVLLTALCMGCFLLGYKYAQGKTDKPVLNKANEDYYKAIANIFAFGTKKEKDDDEE